MSKDKVKPISVWSSVRLEIRVFIRSKTYSLLSVLSLKSGMKGGFPGVEKNVP